MTLKEAIEITERYSKMEALKYVVDFLDAQKLLIEAGKREISNRENPDFVMVGLLPGETRE